MTYAHYFLSLENLIDRETHFISIVLLQEISESLYEKLSGYHNGEVENWIEFFIDGIIEIAEEAIVIVEKITKLKEKDFTKIQALGKRASGSAVAVLPQLYAHPIVNMKLIREWTVFSVS